MSLPLEKIVALDDGLYGTTFLLISSFAIVAPKSARIFQAKVGSPTCLPPRGNNH